MFDQQVKAVYGCKPKLWTKDQFSAILARYKIAYPELDTLKYTTPTEVGIEIEIENVDKGIQSSLWNLTNDGSLRNHGIELVSVPLRDEAVIYAITEYDKGFLYLNPNADFSHRCSIHVHINVANLTVGQLRVLIATYLCLERLFFTLVRPDRIGNSFCFPLADTCCEWEDIEREHLNENYKYAALNPHHLVDFGTLEFRHHGGTRNPTELLNWIDTILKLYKYVQIYNPTQIETTIRNLNTISNYVEFTRNVFEDKFTQFLGLDLYKLMRDNVTAAKVFLN